MCRTSITRLICFVVFSSAIRMLHPGIVQLGLANTKGGLAKHHADPPNVLGLL